MLIRMILSLVLTSAAIYLGVITVFEGHRPNANAVIAATLLSQAQQISAAYTFYLQDHSGALLTEKDEVARDGAATSTELSKLVKRSYLTSVPIPPGKTAYRVSDNLSATVPQATSVDFKVIYTSSPEISTDVCTILRNKASSGSSLFGCVAGEGGNTMWYRL